MSNTINSVMRAGTASTDLSVDDLFDVLSTARRRAVLAVLTGEHSSMDVESLARDVAARERDVAPVTLSESIVEEVHVTLHHVHLPKLDDVGLVDYDPDDRSVTAVETTDAVSIDIE